MENATVYENPETVTIKGRTYKVTHSIPFGPATIKAMKGFEPFFYLLEGKRGAQYGAQKLSSTGEYQIVVNLRRGFC